MLHTTSISYEVFLFYFDRVLGTSSRIVQISQIEEGSLSVKVRNVANGVI